MPYSRPAAPAALERIETFCNSARFLYAEDAFTDPATARTWLGAHGWPDAAAALDGAGLAELRRLREALRDHLEDPVAARDTLNASARRLLGPPQWDPTGAPALASSPAPTAVEALSATLLATLATEELAGRRGRLKVCRAPECRWIYYDRSPANNSVWCSMDICGARHKMRSYRSRRGDGTPPT